ncbi:hypothetical protein [Microvirga solisilvae]|uniref:hypothetical protein n=1 Tax=Microvirga solisilvae TaxID=2919498 RepID=UPI001FAF157A|nr:hypothetical protein [Microvirga solisilvae]
MNPLRRGGRHPQINDVLLAEMVGIEGITRARLAEHFGVTAVSIGRALKRAGLTLPFARNARRTGTAIDRSHLERARDPRPQIRDFYRRRAEAKTWCGVRVSAIVRNREAEEL